MGTPKTYKLAARLIDNMSDAAARDLIYVGDALLLAKSLPAESVDLIFSSPPYCMGKEYENTSSVDDFSENHKALMPDLVRALKPGGSICWQVGYHSDGKQITPLDFLAHQILSGFSELRLRNRIIWSFAHGPHAQKRFSGRHETILWYTKGDRPGFNLDMVRIPQKYPGKRSYKGPNRGELSGNPLGKNPGDVWEIPSVKGSHIEKTQHPCQFPVALPQTFIKAVCPEGGIVFDPFMGVGSTGVAAAIEGRRFLGAEIQLEYVTIAVQRIRDARKGNARFRPLGQPILVPNPTDAVVKKPEHFRG
jgi:adenine-specific DNA-methyltransferase